MSELPAKEALFDLASQILEASDKSISLPELLGPSWTGVSELRTDAGSSHHYFQLSTGGVAGFLPVTLKDGALVVGCVLAFGYPVQAELKPHSEIKWLRVPEDFGLADLEMLATGKLPFPRFHEMVNFTAMQEMSNPNERFPRSCLVMLLDAPKPLRKGIPQRPDHSFVLWTQNGRTVSFHQLERSDNPHIAAEHARKLGFNPTIYRCCSGQMVEFKTTDGGPFL